MRKSLFYVLIFLASVVCHNAEAKVKQQPVYMFGFATSFVDSIAYITEIQLIDSAYVDTKTTFLIGRSGYSMEFQDYLDKNENCKHPVTSILFGKKKEKMEKRRLSLIQRYEKDFKLKTVAYSFHPESYIAQEKKESKAVTKTSKKSSKKY